MTIAEQREKMIEAMCRAMCLDYGEDPDELDSMSMTDADNRALPRWRFYESFAIASLAAISAAGFSIVADGAFEAFDLALVDLARKPE